MIYVDDLLFTGAQSIINTLFNRIQKEVLLRHTGDLTVGSTIHFLGRNISHKGDYIDISVNNNYVDIILADLGMNTCNPAPSPGVPHMNGAAEGEAPLDQEQHKRHRRRVGKIQWLAHTRPDISYGAKELARSRQAPTQLDNKKLKHVITYLKGTRYMRHNLRPETQTQDTRTPLNIDTYTDANWASCETTGKSTTGVALYCSGAAVHYVLMTTTAFAQHPLEATIAWHFVHVSDNVQHMLQPSTFALYSFLLGQHPTMDHHACKTLRMPLTAPE